MPASAQLRWKASSAVLRVLGESGYEALQARWMAHSIRSGRAREAEVDLLPYLVHEGESAVDVGANFGLYAFHLARLVGRNGHVTAVEAVPSTCRSLRRVLALLRVADRVQVVEQGVSDERGTSTFRFNRRPDGTIDAGTAWSARPSAPPGDPGVQVQMSPLDDLVGEVRAEFVKVDTEGAELFVLRGAKELIARCAPTILVEVSAATLRRQGVRREDLDELLASHGYATYRFDPVEERLLAAAASELNGNLLAVHPTRAERVRTLLS